MAKDMKMEEMPEVDNVGIMQGFLEMMNEDDDLEEGDDEYEAGEMLGRTPDSPEILMNNLRGDMRSLDARRDELADLVGYAAAAETPEPVLAMLQPVLAQQGIEALSPGGMTPMPISPQSAPSPISAQSPISDVSPVGAPTGEMPPPVQMAEGGIVGIMSNMQDINRGAQAIRGALNTIEGGTGANQIGGNQTSGTLGGLAALGQSAAPETIFAPGMQQPSGPTGSPVQSLPNYMNQTDMYRALQNVVAGSGIGGGGYLDNMSNQRQVSPVMMAKGGIVQRFRDGSTPAAVSPITGAASEDEAGYISPTLGQSRALAAALMAQRPGRVSDLATLAKAKETAYADVLGTGNKDLAQLGFLTSLANRGFAYAANVDPVTGQPLRGSALSRFAGAARGLPEDIMKMAAAQRKEDQAIKLAAMQSAEKTIAAEREANQKLMEEQYKFAREDIKAAGKAGKITGTSFNQYQELITPFMEGTLNRPGQVRLINAVTDYVQPVTRTYTNKLGNLVTETTRNAIPKSFADAYKRNYGEEAFNAWWKSIDPKQELKISPISLPETAVGAPTPVSDGQKAEVSPVTPSVPAVVEIPAAPKTLEGAQALASSATRPPGDLGKPKLWDVRGYLAGPLNALEAWWASNVPGESPNVIDKSRKDALKANEAFIRALATNNEGKLSVSEMETNRNLVGLSPRIFGGEGSMSTALVSLDDAVALKRKEYEAIVNNPDKYLGSAISEANRKIAMIDEYKASLGVPPSIFNNDQLKNLRAGDEFVDKRSPDAFSIKRKDTFAYQNRQAVEDFRRKNPGKEYGIVQPSGTIKIYRAPK